MMYGNVGSSSCFNPNSFLSDQIGREAGYAFGPERSLLSALLFDGIQAYMNFALAEDETNQAKYREAYNWVVRTGGDYIFSFENVCEALGVDHEFLREGLLEAYHSDAYEWRKTRRNF